MTEQAARLKSSVQFAYVAKYEGDRGPRPAPTGDSAADQLAWLQADMADPACVELVIFGDGFPEQVWRK